LAGKLVIKKRSVYFSGCRMYYKVVILAGWICYVSRCQLFPIPVIFVIVVWSRDSLVWLLRSSSAIGAFEFCRNPNSFLLV